MPSISGISFGLKVFVGRGGEFQFLHFIEHYFCIFWEGVSPYRRELFFEGIIFSNFCFLGGRFQFFGGVCSRAEDIF